MSSFHMARAEAPCSNPDICDIVSPHEDDLKRFDAYNSSEASQETSHVPHGNYIIPGYNPHLIPPPETSGPIQWLSPANEMYYHESRSDNIVPPYYHHDNSNPNFANTTQPKTESLSSASSEYAQHNNQAQQPAQAPLLHAESSNGKAKRGRGKVLNETEAELIGKDDSLLNEEELAIKRKAQNRLAQRAFRERKEGKLKDLQSKLLKSEEERQRLLEELQKIRLQFISVKTENQVLRSNNTGHTSDTQMQNSRFTFPQSQEAFVKQMMHGQQHVINDETVSKIYDEPQHPGQKVLAVGAVWDYLLMKIEEEMYENIDMMEVMQLLKGNEVCHGYGPAYPLTLVDETLQKVANGYNK